MNDAAPVGALGYKEGYLYQQARFWLPPLIAGGLAWLAFLVIGGTPLLRASGLALVIVGMAFILRPMGAALAVIGGLALAFTPSFWIQTGGAESLDPLAVIGAGLAALVIAGGAAVLLPRLLPQAHANHQPNAWLVIAVGIALAIFGAAFLLLVGQPRSLRLTTLATVWALYLLIDGLLVSNPRPDAPPVGRLGMQHTYGLLLVLAIGLFNDPLFVLLIPAALLGLFLTNQRLPVLYWVVLLALAVYGTIGLADVYAAPSWWTASAEAAEQRGTQVPYLIADAWRESSRWLKLIDLVVNQFSAVGLFLGVLGLARLARWYPPVGVVTMIAYGTFGVFGLLYFGADSSTVLLPLLMIQLIWMTYAVYAFGQWVQKTLRHNGGLIRYAAPAAFLLLPALLLWRIVSR